MNRTAAGTAPSDTPPNDTSTATRPTDVLIVGGGLAGLAAAEALTRTQPALRVTLLESKRQLGGRAGSFADPSSGTTVDYCQHAAMGCCTNLLDLIQRCGLSQCFRRYRELTFLHPQSPPSRFAPNRFLPPPLHLAGTLHAQRYLRPAQRIQILRGLWQLMRSRDDKLRATTAARWLSEHGQDAETLKAFWDVILVSALGERTDRVAMSAARKVLIDGFAAARGASDVLIPTAPLSHVFGDRMRDHLSSRGVVIRQGETVRRINADRTVVTGESQLRPDHVICAVPWHRVADLFSDWPAAQRARLPDLETVSNFPTSPITGLHLWFDKPITDLDHAVMVGTVSQWMFRAPFSSAPLESANGDRTNVQRTGDDIQPSSPGGQPTSGHYVQIVISGCSDVGSGSIESLLEVVLSELRHAFPDARQARLLSHRRVTDPNSVFSITPAVEAARPSSRTDVPWLHLAGDWTATGWPATMEGAVISGRKAVESLLGGIDDSPPAALVRPGLPRRWLARRLIRQS
ncbi:FAD-dependent oxidoreductase [Roseiconus nitratireducens]|uniref:FAD-dependent oxidoreductase n=1 Tax=Roseiconus nitratireducens TaxID=2605748 RepID=A0A5M6DDN4_9BACT|nr:hydroxysqualene dehydroxylase HpnE [Roseiconus nitratireducens]KAA5544510.1 FAD-dependent oxidoreductase [Roseiconus nitratireducens]